MLGRHHSSLSCGKLAEFEQFTSSRTTQGEGGSGRRRLIKHLHILGCSQALSHAVEVLPTITQTCQDDQEIVDFEITPSWERHTVGSTGFPSFSKYVSCWVNMELKGGVYERFHPLGPGHGIGPKRAITVNNTQLLAAINSTRRD